jgi:hypothetical protein
MAFDPPYRRKTRGYSGHLLFAKMLAPVFAECPLTAIAQRCLPSRRQHAGRFGVDPETSAGLNSEKLKRASNRIADARLNPTMLAQPNSGETAASRSVGERCGFCPSAARKYVAVPSPAREFRAAERRKGSVRSFVELFGPRGHSGFSSATRYAAFLPGFGFGPFNLCHT